MNTDNPLTVDQAKDLIDKWSTHPGLIVAILDAAQKLKDELIKLERDYDCLAAENALLREDVSILRNNVDDAMQLANKNAKQLTEHASRLVAENMALRTELDQLRTVVAQNNASLSSIVLRWIQPSKN